MVVTTSILFVASSFDTQRVAVAQIAPDGTLPTTVTISEPLNFVIEGGQRSHNHLFHSFESFSVPLNGSAYFNNASAITTIFSRVTGGTVSDIQGLLRTNDTADLFLMNPTGMIFGENASLNIGGSFFATTAESMIFDDGMTFSATAPNTEIPLLNISVPPGLHMGQRSGAITIENRGHQLTGGLFFPTLFNGTPTGLQVAQDQTLGLIAPNITLSGGLIRSTGSTIYLHSIEAGRWSLDESGSEGQLDRDQVERFGTIHLTDQALVETSGLTTGQIQLYGHNIRLDNGSVVMIQNSGPQPSESIIAMATGNLEIAGSIRNAPDQITSLGLITGVMSSRLLTETLSSGQSGDVQVSSENITLRTGGEIVTYSHGAGDGGEVEVRAAQSITIDDHSLLYPDLASAIATVSTNVGRAGDLVVSSENMSVTDGGLLSSYPLGLGSGGDLRLNVGKDLIIGGINQAVFTPTQVGSTTFGPGTGGEVVVDAKRIFISNGADIITATVAAGSAGEVTVNASESIVLDSDIPGAIGVSSIFSGGTTIALGLLDNLGLQDIPSGDSGNVTVNTPILVVEGNSVVSVANEGLGNSGDLRLQVGQVIARDGGGINAFSQSGQGGNIDLVSQEYVLLQRQGRIQADARGANTIRQPNIDGGNIEIRSPMIIGLGNSDIVANAVGGNGGDIQIETQALFGLDVRDRLTPDNDITAFSELGIDGSVNINRLTADPSSGLVELPSGVTDESDRISTGCFVALDNSFTVIGRGGLPDNPTTIGHAPVWEDWRSLETESKPEPIELSTTLPSTTLPSLSDLTIPREATEMIIQANGQVEFVDSTPSIGLPQLKHEPSCVSG